MFRNLMSFWKGRNFLDEVYNDFRQMLDGADRMFVMVSDALLHNVSEPDLTQKIHDADKEINKLQKEVRKRIIEHLALQPSVDVSVCLVLMSLLKDGERLGDYCKNLSEIAELLDEPLDKKVYAEYFGELDKDIVGLFGYTRKAVFDADEEKARLAWDIENSLAKLCDNIIQRIAGSSLSANHAVCYVLTARYFKRIVAHLANIATSTILPLSDIDYFDEQRAQEYNAGLSHPDPVVGRPNRPLRSNETIPNTVANNN